MAASTMSAPTMRMVIQSFPVCPHRSGVSRKSEAPESAGFPFGLSRRHGACEKSDFQPHFPLPPIRPQTRPQSCGTQTIIQYNQKVRQGAVASRPHHHEEPARRAVDFSGLHKGPCALPDAAPPGAVGSPAAATAHAGAAGYRARAAGTYPASAIVVETRPSAVMVCGIICPSRRVAKPVRLVRAAFSTERCPPAGRGALTSVFCVALRRARS